MGRVPQKPLQQIGPKLAERERMFHSEPRIGQKGHLVKKKDDA
jgi:hypothetical protein